MREEGVLDCAIDAETFEDVDCEEVSGPSLTFQGVPWLDAQEIRNVFIGETEKNLSDEAGSSCRRSSRSSATSSTPPTTAGAHRAPHPQQPAGPAQRPRPAATTPRPSSACSPARAANYLLHNQVDLVVGIEDVDLHLDAAPTGAAAAPPAIAPSNHFLEDGIKVLRPVMVADSTVYDAEAGVRSVPNYFARVDAMANRQDLFFAWAQLSAATRPPASPRGLEQRLRRAHPHRRLPAAHRERPGGSASPTECSGPGDPHRRLRPALARQHHGRERVLDVVDEHRPLPRRLGLRGYTGVLGKTPRDGAVGWTSFRNYTLETVGQTFMHETGHILDAVHSAAATGLRCRVLGILPSASPAPRSWAAPATATCARTASRSRPHGHGAAQPDAGGGVPAPAAGVTGEVCALRAATGTPMLY